MTNGFLNDEHILLVIPPLLGVVSLPPEHDSMGVMVKPTALFGNVKKKNATKRVDKRCIIVFYIWARFFTMFFLSDSLDDIQKE